MSEVSTVAHAEPTPGATFSLLADGYAYGRIVLGVTGIVAPGPVGTVFGIGATPQARVAARHIAARDLVAGMGMVLGRRRGKARGWYEAAALTDLLDVLVAVAAGRRGVLTRSRASLVVVLAGGSAAAGLLLARRVDEDQSVSSSAS